MIDLTRRAALIALSALTLLSAAGCSSSSADAPTPSAAQAFDGYPYASRFAQLSGGRMHYVDEGSGTPVVMLHGVPTWSYLWRNVIPYVSRGDRAIAPDMLNHGKSDKNGTFTFAQRYADFEELVAKLELKNLVLVLHDWGASVGFLYAARHPENVRGIVFFEAMLGPAPSLDGFPSVVKDMRGPNGYDLVVNQNVFLEQILPQLAMNPLPEAVLAAYRTPFANPNDRLQLLQWPKEIPVMGDGTPNLPAFGEYGQFLAKSAIPKLMIYAEPGVLGTADAVQYARNTYTNLKSVSVGKGAHLLQEDSPDAVGQAIRTWLDGI